ncbi:uncharacterized protein JCM6883_002914 [Sporobolomyces salmoneus]|uniref:uncharacterized protein n=1 Tax=Sporobolomyces salmoneus TaxID=183962 RepID=UPI0031773EFA
MADPAFLCRPLQGLIRSDSEVSGSTVPNPPSPSKLSSKSRSSPNQLETISQLDSLPLPEVNLAGAIEEDKNEKSECQNPLLKNEKVSNESRQFEFPSTTLPSLSRDLPPVDPNAIALAHTSHTTLAPDVPSPSPTFSPIFPLALSALKGSHQGMSDGDRSEEERKRRRTGGLRVKLDLRKVAKPSRRSNPNIGSNSVEMGSRKSGAGKWSYERPQAGRHKLGLGKDEAQKESQSVCLSFPLSDATNGD